MQVHQMSSGSKGTKASVNLYRGDSMAPFDFDQDLYNIRGTALRRRERSENIIDPEIKNKFLVFFRKDSALIKFFLKITWVLFFSLGFVFYYLPKKYVLQPYRKACEYLKDQYNSLSSRINHFLQKNWKKIESKIPTVKEIKETLKIPEMEYFFKKKHALICLKMKLFFNFLKSNFDKVYKPVSLKILLWIETIRLKQKALVKMIRNKSQRKSISSVFLKSGIQKGVSLTTSIEIFSHKNLRHMSQFTNEKIVKVRSIFFLVIQHVIGFAHVFKLRVDEIFKEVLLDVQQAFLSYDLDKEKKIEVF